MVLSVMGRHEGLVPLQRDRGESKSSHDAFDETSTVRPSKLHLPLTSSRSTATLDRDAIRSLMRTPLLTAPKKTWTRERPPANSGVRAGPVDGPRTEVGSSMNDCRDNGMPNEGPTEKSGEENAYTAQPHAASTSIPLFELSI